MSKSKSEQKKGDQKEGSAPRTTEEYAEEAQRIEGRRQQALRESRPPADSPAMDTRDVGVPRSITSVNTDPVELDEDGEPVQIPEGQPSAAATATRPGGPSTTTVDRAGT